MHRRVLASMARLVVPVLWLSPAERHGPVALATEARWLDEVEPPYVLTTYARLALLKRLMAD